MTYKTPDGKEIPCEDDMPNEERLIDESEYLRVVFAFLDVTYGMKSHDFFNHMGGTEKRATEVVAIRDNLFAKYGKQWLGLE